MARNLVKEKEEALPPLETADKVETAPTTEYKVISEQQLIISILDNIYSKMIEGFKQVGVKFEEVKQN